LRDCPVRYELTVGSSIDPDFGPIIAFGAGRQPVEVRSDVALALPPLNAASARQLIEETRIDSVLKEEHGNPSWNLGTLARMLVRFSKLIVEQPWIRESEIDLAVSLTGIFARDPKIIVHADNVTAEELPKPAIKPYPTQYIRPWKTNTGIPVLIRPIRPEDEPLLANFHRKLSNTSVYLRYFQKVPLEARVSHQNLMYECFIDYGQEMALVADFHNTESREHEIWALGRLAKMPGAPEGEIDLLVSDEHQQEGLGTELLRRLIEVARDEKLERIGAKVLAENDAIRLLGRHFDFQVGPCTDPNAVFVFLDLRGLSSSGDETPTLL
jgi:acetyltransferase